MSKLNISEEEIGDWYIAGHHGDLVQLAKKQDSGNYKKIEVKPIDSGFSISVRKDCLSDVFTGHTEDGEYIEKVKGLSEKEILKHLNRLTNKY
jgi:hypothetical protein